LVDSCRIISVERMVGFAVCDTTSRWLESKAIRKYELRQQRLLMASLTCKYLLTRWSDGKHI